MYLVEAYHVDYPGTEPCSSRGFLPYKVRVELRVTEVLILHTPHCGLRDMLFIKVHQSLQEFIYLQQNVWIRYTVKIKRHIFSSYCSKRVGKKHNEMSLENTTLLITILEAFQLRSLGIRPWGANRTRTAAETLVTIAGGFGNVLSSVKFSWKGQRETGWSRCFE